LKKQPKVNNRPFGEKFAQSGHPEYVSMKQQGERGIMFHPYHDI
jgi:hypothetical protein